MRVEFAPVLGKTKRLSVIGIDLVVDQTPPEDYVLVSPASRLDIAGLPTYDYALQTIEERIADKICAMMQMYEGAPSSRVKDLADLVVSKLTDEVDADALLIKLHRESMLRNMEHFKIVHVPKDWTTTKMSVYKKEAERASIPPKLTDIVQAETAVASWLEPVLRGELAHKKWNPRAQRWIDVQLST